MTKIRIISIPKFNSGGNLNSDQNSDLIKYNVGTHSSGNDQMINKLGLPTNNENDAVGKIQKTETIKDGYVYSDDLGLNKNKEIELNPRKVKQTFSDISRKIDNKFKGRDDELSNVTKNFMYKNLTEKNEMALQSKFQKSFSSFQKKWGGMLNKYPLGGDLTANPFGFEQLQDNILGRGNWQPYNTNNLESGASSASDQYNFAQGILPNNNDGLTGAMGENMEVFPMKYNNSRIATMPLKDRYNEYSKMNSPASANKSTNLSIPGGEGINYADYISPAFNTIAAGISLFNKNKNYLEKPNNEALTTLQGIQTTPDYSQLYNRNTRSLRAADKTATNYSPSIRNSLQANNLGTKLNADNEIAFREQAEKLDRETNKKGAIAQLQDSNNRFRQAAMHTYQNENTQDASKRQDNALGYLGAAVNDISNIGYDKELGKILNEGLKYYSYDSKTGKYMYKNNVGRVFYSSVSPNEVSKKTTE